MSLSSLIVQREIATIREVEEALARQVLYGGDLVTNLLEVCRVDESALNTLVADSFGLPAAPSGELPRPSEEARKALAPEVAQERAVAVLSADRYGLVVAVAEPLPSEAEQELSFALGVPISQQIAPLVRIREAIARDYGIPLDKRMKRVLGKIRGEVPAGVPSMHPPPPPTHSPPRPPSIAPAPPPSQVELPPPSEENPATLVRDIEVPPARPARRRRGPLTTEVARTELDEVEERDAIFDLVFEYARQYFDYTVLFTVKDDVAEGRDAYGDGAPRDKVARIAVPLDVPSSLKAARDAKALVRGHLASRGVDATLLADLGRTPRGEQIVLPIVVRNRVVAILLGDAGEAGIDETSVADVRGIFGAAAAAFERLVVRRKLKGTWPPPGGAAAKISSPPPGSSTPPTKVSQEPPPADDLPPPVREIIAEALAPISSFDKGLADLPPPAKLLEVRRPSGRPIPREEPEAEEAVQVLAPVTQISPPQAGPVTRKTPAGFRRAEAPPLEFAAKPPPSSLGEQPFVEDEVERRLLEQIHGGPSTTRDARPPVMTRPPPDSELDGPRSPKALSPVPPRPASITAVSPGALPMFPDPTAGADFDKTPAMPQVMPSYVPSSSSSKPMPVSEQQISVSPRKPPSSWNDESRVLPSVMVDVAGEYSGLVDRVLAGSDDDAESELLRAGAYAMPAIMARFPGPITVDRERIVEGHLPRVGECGPILRLVSSQRRTALPSVLALVEDRDVEKRFWATYLMTELVYPDAVGPVVERVFDDEPRVRRAARAAIRALAESMPDAVIERLEAIARDPSSAMDRRERAAETLADTREAQAVRALIGLTSDAPKVVSAAARSSLVVITRQDFGLDVDRWRAWWSKNEARHRVEWLIDALIHDDPTIRAASGEELKLVSKEYFGYQDDLPKRERERIQQRYREWWTAIGRTRFSRRS